MHAPHKDHRVQTDGHCVRVYSPLSGVPRFPSSRSADGDFALEHHDLHRKEQLHRRFRAPPPAIFRLKALRLKAFILYTYGIIKSRSPCLSYHRSHPPDHQWPLIQAPAENPTQHSTHRTFTHPPPPLFKRSIQPTVCPGESQSFIDGNL